MKLYVKYDYQIFGCNINNTKERLIYFLFQNLSE